MTDNLENKVDKFKLAKLIMTISAYSIFAGYVGYKISANFNKQNCLENNVYGALGAIAALMPIGPIVYTIRKDLNEYLRKK